MVLAPEYSDNKNKGKDYIETVMNLTEFPLLDQTNPNSVISTTSNDLSWSRLPTLWPLLYGTSCCFIEFASLIGSQFDFDCYGLVPRSSPRQADLILIAGTVTMKMAPSLVRLYEQMPEPKYVITMGACTNTGGMFTTDSYATVRAVDKLIPMDVYLSGCLPKLEAVIDEITKLCKKISREIYEDRIGSKQKNRLALILEITIKNCSINHHLLQLSIFINFIVNMKYTNPDVGEIKKMQNHLSAWLIKHELVHRYLGFNYQGIETLQIKLEDWDSIIVISYVYGYNYLRSQWNSCLKSKGI